MQGFIMNSTTDSSSTLNNITDALALTDIVMVNLTEVKGVAKRILDINSSFTIEDAETLAQQINDTILPDEVVVEIIQNATIAKQAANETLAIASGAR